MSKSLAAKFAKGFATSVDLAKAIRDKANDLEVKVELNVEETGTSTVRNYRFTFNDGSRISVFRVVKHPGCGDSYTAASWQNGSGLRYKANVLPKSF